MTLSLEHFIGNIFTRQNAIANGHSTPFLEYYYMVMASPAGMMPPEMLKQRGISRIVGSGACLLRNQVNFSIEAERRWIYEKCDSRVDNMFREGVIDEVKNLKNKNYLM